LEYPFWEIFLFSQIATHIISSFSIITSHFIGRILKEKKPFIYTLLVFVGSLIAATLGTFVSYVIKHNLFHLGISSSLYDYLRQFIIPILIITSIITLIAIFVERLRDKKIKLEHDLREMKDKIIDGETKKKLLSFKDGENHYVMECSDIIYLSSYGRKTIIHTANRDYETLMLLKEIVRKLPPDEFIRIHKRFTVNLRYVSRVQYYEGGRYRVYLEDDDDSTLPVGPTFTSMLKARLQI
jgi:hypothetical protein